MTATTEVNESLPVLFLRLDNGIQKAQASFISVYFILQKNNTPTSAKPTGETQSLQVEAGREGPMQLSVMQRERLHGYLFLKPSALENGGPPTERGYFPFGSCLPLTDPAPSTWCFHATSRDGSI